MKPFTSYDATLRMELAFETQAVVENARKVFPRLSMINPSVGFFTKSVNAGTASYGTWRVEYNEVIAKTNRAVFHNTVIHEVSHLVTKKLFPYATAHGPEFKRVMRALGGEATRCHNYNVAAVFAAKGQKRFIYKCSCRDHSVSGRKHKNMVMGGYRCSKCKTEVKWTGRTA